MKKQNNVLAYRKKHPRCRYCKFRYLYVPLGLGGQYSWWKCKLKDIRLVDWEFLLWRWQGCFCKWFQPKWYHPKED